MRAYAAAFGTAALMVGAAHASFTMQAAPAAKYAALAVDRAKGFFYGFSHDQPDRASATRVALQGCKDKGGNCSVVIELAGQGCAAYYTLGAEDGSAYGWGTGATEGAAQSRASAECNAFAGAGKVCQNHVFACNAAGSSAFKVLREEPVKPTAAKPSATDCLIQFSADLERGKDYTDWMGEFKSPAYRLAKADCPSATGSQYHSFFYRVDPGEKPFSGESNAEGKNPAGYARGIDYATRFQQWLESKKSPFGEGYWRHIGSVTVTTATDANIATLTKEAGDDNQNTRMWPGAAGAVGTCVDYTLPGVTPVATYGAENCRRWVR